MAQTGNRRSAKGRLSTPTESMRRWSSLDDRDMVRRVLIRARRCSRRKRRRRGQQLSPRRRLRHGLRADGLFREGIFGRLQALARRGGT